MNRQPDISNREVFRQHGSKILVVSGHVGRKHRHADAAGDGNVETSKSIMSVAESTLALLLSIQKKTLLILLSELMLLQQGRG